MNGLSPSSDLAAARDTGSAVMTLRPRQSVYFQRLRNSEGHSIELAAREAAEKRFRPVLMTTLVATLGLLPAALSNGIGSQTQKPLAIVVIGGSLILAILTRVVQPPLLGVAHTWLERRFGGRGGSTPHLSGEDDHFVT
jgi:Cu/Ag efflux pump CusA